MENDPSSSNHNTQLSVIINTLLQDRASALRRKSCDLFKTVADRDKEKEGEAEGGRRPSVAAAVERAEHAHYSEDGELRAVQVTSL